MNESAAKKLVPIVLSFIVTGAALWGYWFFYSRYIETTDNAYIEADMAIIAPRVAGYVSELMVNDNALVNAGDPLLRIEDQDYRAKVAQAEALVGARRAAMATIQSQITLQRAIIAQAEADVVSAQAERERVNADLVRYRELADVKATSRQQLDSAIAGARRSQAALDAANARLNAEQVRLQVYEARREEARAALGEADAHLTLARIDLDNTLLRAPVDGVIGNKHVQLGQYLRPGTQVLTVVPLPQVHVTANFKETQVKRMGVGQPVTLLVDAYPNAIINGYIESFSPATGSRFSLLPPENATGNFTKIVQRIPVRIRIPADIDLHEKLRPGMSVIATVDVREAAETNGGKQLTVAGRTVP